MDSTGKAQRYLSPKARARQWWLRIHRWLGLALLVPMALLGLTGSALVWPEKTELLLNPQRAVSAEADPAAIEVRHIAAARDALAQYGPVTAAMIGDVGDPMVFGTSPIAPPHMGLGPPTRMAAYIDPVSGNLLDIRRSTGDFMWFMHAIHGHLLLKGVGRPVVGVMGLFLLISAVTGLVIWWPGRRKILAALKWRKREGKMLNVHRQSGVLLSLVLIVEAITGAWIAFPDFFAAMVTPTTAQAHGVEHEAQPAANEGPLSSAPIAFADEHWVAALTAARTAYPARPASMQAPASNDGSWQFMLVGSKGPAEVLIPAQGGVAQVDYRLQTATTATRMEYAMTAFHAGQVGGPIWQWLTFLSGIFLAFLSISGLYVWGKRKFVQKANRPSRGETNAAAVGRV